MHFNNCKKRDHLALYGSDAFFDLEVTGPQSSMADRLENELNVGDRCIVATPDVVGDVTCDVTFNSYRFSRHAILPDPVRNVSCHAYFGELVGSHTMSRPEAMAHSIYSHFFNVNGHFKRRSVMRSG
jgi:hypothetical protein